MMLEAIASIIANPPLSLLLGLAIRSLIVLALGAAILALMGRKASASARYLVMLICMMGLLCLPLLSRLAPTWRVPILPASLAPGASAPVATGAQDEGVHKANPMVAGGTMAASTARRSMARTPLAGRRGMMAPFQMGATRDAFAKPLRLSPAGWITVLWLSGAALYCSWLLIGRLRLWRLAGRCPVVTDGPLTALIGELAAHCDVRSPIVVRQAARTDGAFVTPMTWGWLRPVLLMPGGVLEEWPAERLRAVLLHELAHIARLDWLTQAATQLACALYWFNPFVWKMATAMEREAEQACDDRVLLAGVQASDYAGHLLEVVKSLRMLHGAVLQGGAQTMAAPRSNVQARLIAIMAADRNRAQATRRAALLALGLSALVLAPLAALYPARAANPAQHKTATVETDAAPIMQATQWSWRGDWAKAAAAADRALQAPNADDSTRANAYWIKFESAWWMDDLAESDRNYELFAAMAAKHPDDAVMQANQTIAGRYRGSIPLTTKSNEAILATIKELKDNQAYADALHAARYLLNRRDVPATIRAEALVVGYAGARYWNYKDTQDLLSGQFQAELKRLPESERQTMQQKWENVTKMIKPKDSDSEVNPVSHTDWKSVTLTEPTNLDFRKGTANWKVAAEDGTGSDYQMGVVANATPDGPAAYLTARNDPPANDGVITQTCRADAYRGKRIRFSALLRAENVEKSAGFYLHLDAPDRVRVWNTLAKPMTGTTDWMRQEYVVDVAANNQGFIFGIDLEGKGKIWVRDIRFEVVDKSVPVSPVNNDFPIDDGKGVQAAVSIPAGMSDQPINFEFKNGIDGWFNDNPEHNSEEDYQIGIDDRTTHNGHTAAYLTAKVDNPRSYGTLMQNITATAYHGKRIRYSAYLKTQDAVKGAGLWMVMYGAKQEDNAGRNMTENPITGTNDWKQVSWVMDVPEGIQTLSFGIDLTGKGKVWVSDFQLEVVGKDVPLTP